MIINIMPNIFSKIASQNGTIKLFAGGKQLKSLVNLVDVVRCMKFMEENSKIKNEIFHLVNEQTTVRKVAEICKKICLWENFGFGYGFRYSGFNCY